MFQTPLISVENINLEFDSVSVLKDVSLSVQAGQIVSLIGPNGAGKTSLVKILLGLLSPTTGQLKRKPGLTIAYLPQRFLIEPTMPITVERFLGLTAERKNKPIATALEEAGIQALRRKPMQSISGGEMQRVMLARCLLSNPELLVLDEPDQGMDMAGQESLYNLIGGIRDRYQCGVVMVSHDLHLVMAATDEVVCLNHHVCCSGHPEAISKHPEFLQLFDRPQGGLAVYAHDHDHDHDLHGNVIHD